MRDKIMTGSRGYWRTVWDVFRKNRFAMTGLVTVSVLFFIAIFAPFIANDRPYIYVSEEKVYFPIISRDRKIAIHSHPLGTGDFVLVSRVGIQ